LPDEALLAIEYLDAAATDGLARKYRVMFIDGAQYPLHLAISADWKVHYFSAAMKERPDLREEERSFLNNIRATLGARACTALDDVQTCLGLDYGGIDFALSADGSILLFEANATMVINPPKPHRMWDYRRAAINTALEAARHLIERHALAR
jgi:glutathione synthase/RimK-type ligase-like ATP-grasp enzyme